MLPTIADDMQIVHDAQQGAEVGGCDVQCGGDLDHDVRAMDDLVAVLE